MKNAMKRLLVFLLICSMFFTSSGFSQLVSATSVGTSGIQADDGGQLKKEEGLDDIYQPLPDFSTSDPIDEAQDQVPESTQADDKQETGPQAGPQAAEEEEFAVLQADEKTSNDLKNFIKSVSLEGAERISADTYRVIPNRDYNFTLSFRELGSGELQFDNTTMYYRLPEGLNASTQQDTIDCNVDGVTVSGNTYKIEGNVLTFNWNKSDPNFPKITSSSLAYLNFDIKAKVAANASEIDFGGNAKIKVDVDTKGKVNISKTGIFNGETGKVDYTVTVNSVGLSKDVVVKDIISGTALTMDQASLTVTGSDSCTISEQNEKGFVATILQINDGESVKFTYSASVDPSMISGNGTKEETENGVTVTNGDDSQDSKTVNLENQIQLTGIAKNAGKVVNEDGSYTIPWTVTYNEQALVSMKGATITDTNLSADLMSYDGKVTVTKYEKDGGAWKEAGTDSFDPQSDSQWTYQIQDDEIYKYVFTYETKVSAEKAASLTKDTQVSNKVEDGKGHNSSASGTIGIDEKDKNSIAKEATAVGSDEITWTITIHVSARGAKDAVLTDTYPTVNNGKTYFDTLKEGSVEVISGLFEGESIKVEDKGSYAEIKFYDGEEPGLRASDDGRVVKVKLTTKVDPTWVEAARTLTWMKEHQNKAQFGDLTATASAIPKDVSIQKFLGDVKITAEDGMPVYNYRVKFMGVDGTFSFEDAFDTEYLELYTPENQEMSLSIGGGGQYYTWEKWSYNVVKVEGSTFTVEDKDIPKTDKGDYFDAYEVSYFLKVKDADTLEKLRQAAIENNGKYTLTNTATIGSASSDANVDYTYDALNKQLIKAPNGKDTTAKYQIDFNPDAAKMNDGKNIVLKDIFENMIIKDSTISIKDKDGNVVEGAKAEYTDKNELSITVPDETAIVITYEATVVPDQQGKATLKNTVSWKGFKKTTESYVEIDTSGSGGAENYKINILKVKEGSLVKLKDAEFEVYKASDNRKLVKKGGAKLITDENGKVTVFGDEDEDGWSFNPGVQYYLIETVAPEGFILDSTSRYYFTFTEDPSEINHEKGIYINGDEMVIENKEQTEDTGSLKVTKTTSGNTTPDDATFTVKNAAGDIIVIKRYSEFKDAGFFTVPDLPLGDYTVIESGADIANYTLEVTGNTTATVEAGKEASVALTNTYTEAKGSLKISKTTSGNTTPDNATFTVWNAKNEKVAEKKYSEFKEAGSFTVPNLPVGAYTVIESGAEITNYDLTVSGDGEVAVAKDTEAKVTITNTYSQDKGSLKVSKTTSGNTTPDNATFTVKNAAGTVVAEKKYSEFKEAGSFTVPNLPVGTYTVSESGADIANYDLTVSGDGEVAVAKDTEAKVTITNTYSQDKGSLKVSKTTSGNTTPDDATFTVKNAAGTVVAEKKYSEFKEAGSFTVPNLPVGTYTVSESGASVANYDLTVSGDGEVAVAKDTEAKVTITNTYSQDKGSLKVSKTTNGNTTPDDATFTVKNAKNETVAEKKYSEFKEAGSFTVPNLPVGTYTVSESGAEIANYALTVSGDGEVAVAKDTEAKVTITNTYSQDKGSLKVSKTTSGNTTPDDATFTVKNAKNETVAEKKYSEFKEAGFFTVPNLPVGTYTVSESGASVANYDLTVSGDGEVAVAKDTEAKVTITNTYSKDKGSLKVSKTTNGNTTPDDATFTVKNAAGTVVAEKKYSEFKEAGSFTVPNLPIGKYTVSESGADIASYDLLVTGEGEVAVTKDTEAKVEITNTYTAVTKVAGKKVWDDDENRDGLRPEKITVQLQKKNENGKWVKVEGKEYKKTISEKNDWKYTFKDLPKFEDGKEILYRVQETEVPEGYELTTKAKKENNYVLTNKHVPERTKVEGKKVWVDNQYDARPDSIEVILSKTVGDVTEEVDSKTVKADIDGNWTYKFDNLYKYENGIEIIYTVKEAGAKNYDCKVVGYDLKNTAHRGSLKIVKNFTGDLSAKDLNDNQKAAITFNVTGPKGYKVKNLSLADFEEVDGKLVYTLDELSVGEYTVEENHSKFVGYVRTTSYKVNGEEGQTATIVKDTAAEVLITNKYEETSVKISKVDVADGKELEGAHIQIVDKNGKVVEEWDSKKDKAHEVKGLHTGEEYTLKETVAPDGYTITTDTKFVLKEDGTVDKDKTSTTVSDKGVLLVEDEMTSVKISKVDIADGKELEGAHIQIVDKNGKVVEEWDSKKDKVHEVKGLHTGEEYTLKETVAPDGYTITTDTKFVLKEDGTVDKDKTSTTVSDKGVLLVEDEMTSVKISKVDIADGKELEGAHIQIVDKNGKVVEEWDSKKDEAHEVKGLKTGEEYTLKETVAPDGYSITTDTKFVLKEDGTVDKDKTSTTVSDKGVLLVEDEMTSVKISKVDIADGTELEGAHIQIVDKNGKVVEEWDSTDKAHEVKGLKTGEEYTLKETIAPDGYSITTDTTFVLKEDGTVDTDQTTTSVSEEGVLLVEDTMTSVKISKVDVTDQHELIGAHIQILDEDGNIVDEWTSEEEAHEVTGLVVGKEYTLKETVAPDGYSITTDTTFILKEDGTIDTDQTKTNISEEGILLVEDTTSDGPEKEITVEKFVTIAGKKAMKKSGSFYIGLFYDEECTDPVKIGEVVFSGWAYSSKVTFENLGEGTYYVAETDKDGNVRPSQYTQGASTVTILGDHQAAVTVNDSKPKGKAAITNDYDIPDEYLKVPREIKVEKIVSRNQIPYDITSAAGKSYLKDKEFYMGLFCEEDETYYQQVTLNSKNKFKAEFKDIPDGFTYYVYEVDQNGDPVGDYFDYNDQISYKVTYNLDGDTVEELVEVTFTEGEENVPAVTVTNDEQINEIIVTKHVSKNGEDVGKNFPKTTFYFSVFTDKALTQLATDINGEEIDRIPMTIVHGQNSEPEVFIMDPVDEGEVNYYVVEVDKKTGKPVGQSFKYDVYYNGLMTFAHKATFKAGEGKTEPVLINNDIPTKETTTEYYSGGGNGSGNGVDSTSAKTGDDNPLAMYILLLIAAATLGGFELRRKRKEEN